MLHQDIVNFSGILAFERQVEVPNHFGHADAVQLLALRKEVPDERLDVLIHLQGALSYPDDGHVAAANHDHILHQVRMKTLAQLQEQFRVLRIRIPPAQIDPRGLGVVELVVFRV